MICRLAENYDPKPARQSLQLWKPEQRAASPTKRLGCVLITKHKIKFYSESDKKGLRANTTIFFDTPLA